MLKYFTLEPTATEPAKSGRLVAGPQRRHGSNHEEALLLANEGVTASGLTACCAEEISRHARYEIGSKPSAGAFTDKSGVLRSRSWANCCIAVRRSRGIFLSSWTVQSRRSCSSLVVRGLSDSGETVRCHEVTTTTPVGSNPGPIGVAVGHVALGRSSAKPRLSGPAGPGVFRGVGVSALGNRDCGRCVLQRGGCLSCPRQFPHVEAIPSEHPRLCSGLGRLCWPGLELADSDTGRDDSTRPGVWNPGFARAEKERAGSVSTNSDPLHTHSLESAKSRVSAPFRVCGVNRRIPQHVSTRPLDA